MARRVFFSFHWERDIWRISRIRNSWVTQDREAAGFWDAADWEAVKRGGEEIVHRWIDGQLSGTSVTVVLVGAETADRNYITYAVKASHQKVNGLLAVTLHNIKDRHQRRDRPGRNPFDNLYIDGGGGRRRYLSAIYPTYDWVLNDGSTNFASWVERSARAVGR